MLVTIVCTVFCLHRGHWSSSGSLMDTDEIAKQMPNVTCQIVVVFIRLTGTEDSIVINLGNRAFAIRKCLILRYALDTTALDSEDCTSLPHMSKSALKLVSHAEAEPHPADLLKAFATEANNDRKLWMALPRLTTLHAVVAAFAIIAGVEFVLLASASRTPPQPAAAVADTGTVVIESTPSGAALAIDGADRGITPSTLALKPGNYVMSVTLGDVSRSMPLVVRAGSSTERIYFSEVSGSALAVAHTVAPVTSPATVPAGAVGGWLSVSAPVDLQLFEGGVLVGSTETDRIMLSVGRHRIDAVNKTVGYETSSVVQVSAGSVARLKLEIPNGTLNINAAPWAEVAVDGKPLGPTPLGNISLPVGSHNVVFTHPQLGERRQAVVVTLNGTNRISVNLNQPQRP